MSQPPTTKKPPQASGAGSSGSSAAEPKEPSPFYAHLVETQRRHVLMLEGAAVAGRFRLVTSSQGQPLWVDRAAAHPKIRSGVAQVPIEVLRRRFLEAIFARGSAEKWPQCRPFHLVTKVWAHLAAKTPQLEAWVHQDSLGSLAPLGIAPIRACSWMPARAAMVVPTRIRVGMEWVLQDGSSSVALWAPDQVGVAW